jgi:hypothetical protein
MQYATYSTETDYSVYIPSESPVSQVGHSMLECHADSTQLRKLHQQVCVAPAGAAALQQSEQQQCCLPMLPKQYTDVHLGSRECCSAALLQAQQVVTPPQHACCC